VSVKGKGQQISPDPEIKEPR